MPPNEDAWTVGAKVKRLAAILADGKDLEANSSHNIDPVRRATRDALEELDRDFDSPADVAAVELPSERLGEPEAGGDEDDDGDADGDEETEE